MSVSHISQESDTRFKADLHLSEEEYTVAQQAALEKLQKKVSVAGFRKGKVPLHIIKKKFADDVFESMLREAIFNALPAIEKKSGHKIYTIAEVGRADPTSAHLKVSVKVDIMPYVKLGKLKEAQLREHIPAIDEADIQKQLNKNLLANATYEEKEGVFAEEGDKLRVDYEIWIGGAPTGEVEKDFTFILGDRNFQKDIEQKIIEGKGKVGEEFTYKKESLPEAENENKGYEIFCTIRGIGKPILPQISDDWVKENRPPFTSVSEFKTNIKETLEMRFKNTVRAVEVEKAVITLHKSAKFFMADSYIMDLVNDFLGQRGISPSNVPQDLITELKTSAAMNEEKSLLSTHLLRLAEAEKKGKSYKTSFRDFVLESTGYPQANPGTAQMEEVIGEKIDKFFAGEELERVWDNILKSHLQVFNVNYLFDFFKSEGIVKKGNKLSLAELVVENKTKT